MTLESNLTTAFQAIGRDVKDLSTAGGVLASRQGVSTDSSDNSSALASIATRYQTLTGTVLVDLPPGVVRGHLPMAPGIVWRFNGTTLKPPNSGPTKHMTYPLDPVWADGCRTGLQDVYGEMRVAGAGAHRCGIVGSGVIDGEASRWNITPVPIGPTPTVAQGTGSLATGSGNYYAYKIAYRTGFGIGRPGGAGDRELLAGGGTVVSWTNPPGAAGAQVVVYGRGPWGPEPWQELVTLPPGTTTWTDDGSAMPGTYYFDADMSAPAGLFMTGAGYQIRGDIRVVDVPGTGLASRWEAELPINEPPTRQMEANIDGLYIENPGADGAVFHGPHDTIVNNLYVVRPGALAPDARDGVVFGVHGPYVLKSGHIWGYHRRSITALGFVYLCHTETEGARDIGIWLQDKAQVVGAKVFYPGTATARGVVIGTPSYKATVAVSGLYIEGFSSGSGAALDINNAGNGSQISGMVRQDSGTAVTTGYSTRLNLDVEVAGTGWTQSARPVLTLTQAQYDALTVKHPATLYVIQG